MRKIIKALLAVPALFIVPVVRLISPFILIRFISLPSDRIGHFAGNTEMYLCHRDAGKYGDRTIDIFYCRDRVCNRQLKKMLGRCLRIIPYARLMDSVNRLFPGWQRHTLTELPSDRDTNGFYAKRPSHLFFTEEEKGRGRLALESLGVPKGAPYVCFHARDAAYLDAVEPDKKWYYHNYEDVALNSYLSAAEELTRRGYYVIRLGAIVARPLNTKNPMIIDYATKERSDFLDIYLCANCEFFLASASGLSSVPLVFRKPIAWSNFVPLEYIPTWDSRGILILKKLKRRQEGRFLPFREILDLGAGRFLHTEQYDKLGLEVIDNTPEEIASLAIETQERLKGTWQNSEEDVELQRRFWSIFRTGELHGDIALKIGADFLRRNRELLD